MAGQILEGMTVVDMSTLLAAPLSTSLLSDFGARVIKIEHPVGGDPLRAFPPYRDGVPLQNKVVNRNKQSVAIDLHAPEGKR
jgi:crotonobetainyl-CoA:carnitine CoA-transferase CaiB-like acyl-CoA transferase